jgi:hypothetical protein
MLSSNDRVNRLIIGKIIGLIFGGIAFWASGFFVPGFSLEFKWGFLLWYVLFGHIIANTINAKEYIEEVYKLHIHWSIPCTMVGGALSLSLALMMHRAQQGKIHFLVLSASGHRLSSPYWFVLDAILGAIVIGFILNTYCKKSKS